MASSDWIAIASAIIAIVGFVYTWLTNTKKFELTEQYRNCLLLWYDNTLKTLVKLRLLTESDCLDQNAKYELLSALSSQIEVGRFFFPNIDRGDSFGEEKPTAYRGYRHIALEFLVFSYRILAKEDAKKYLSHTEELQRHFTSHIFELLQPKRYNKSIRKHTDVIFPKEILLDEFLMKDPRSFVFYS